MNRPSLSGRIRALERGQIVRGALGGVAGILLALYVADAATAWTGRSVHGVLRDWFVLVLYAGAAASCLTRGIRVRADRVAWSLIGIGIASYALGTLIFTLGSPGPADVNAPVASDVLWLAFYPAAIAAVVIAVTARAPRLPFGVWLDAAGAGLSLAAILAAVALPVVTDSVHHVGTVALGLAFPWFDVVLITLMLWVLSLTRWRPHRTWMLMTAAFVLLGVGDTALALRVAEGVFVRGELTSACFPLAMLTLGLAARQPPPPQFSEPVISRRMLAFPATVFMAAAVLLAIYVAQPFSRVAGALAVAALVVGVIRGTAVTAQVRELYESRRYARGFQDAALGMALVDWDLRWLRVNPGLCEMLRYPADQLVGRSVLEVTFEDDLVPLEQEREKGLVNPRRSVFEKRYVRSDGVVLDVEITTSLIEDDELGSYFYTQVRDISDRRRAERRQELVAELGHRALEAKVLEEYLQHAMEALTDALDVNGCALLRPDGTDRLQYVAYTGPRADPYPTESMAGWVLSQRRAVVSNDLAGDARFRVRPDVLEATQRAICVPVRAQRPHVIVTGASSDRDPFDVEDSHFLEAVANILASVLDRDVADQELRRLALVDGLTGLANRTMLDHHLGQALSAARRVECDVAVLLLDVDNFKYVNDTLGHPAGDDLLRGIGGRLQAAIREEDLLARLGGDEFVVVCTVPSGELDVPRLADRLLSTLAEPFTAGDQDLHVGASVGIAVSECGAASSPAEMLRDADIAMYRAKGRSGNAYEVFDTDLRRRILRRVQLEHELREALRTDDQLVLYYQPIVDLRTGAVRGFEALVRWQHPRDGLLSPGTFLPVAEESGLIVPMGERLLDLACARVPSWGRSNQRPYVSFNLSSRQLTSEIPRTIAHCLHEHGASPDQLKVEVTEHVLLNPNVAVPVLEDLREMGIEVALDDFGTGYSSLSYLETYPLDAIKLDRGFVARSSASRSAAILRAAVEMGSALGLQVVAEGIENEEQRELLQSVGCTLGQGYLFARPLPPEEADTLVADVVV